MDSLQIDCGVGRESYDIFKKYIFLNVFFFSSGVFYYLPGSGISGFCSYMLKQNSFPPLLSVHNAHIDPIVIYVLYLDTRKLCQCDL